MCSLGPNSQSKPFSAFFSKTKGFGENFGPKQFQGTHPFWVHQADQMAKILIFGQKTVLAEISVTPKIRLLGAGWPIFFRPEPKNWYSASKKFFIVSNSFWGAGVLLESKNADFRPKIGYFRNFGGRKCAFWVRPALRKRFLN